MLRVRSVKTSSGAVAIQVVEYHQGRMKVMKHVGSAQDKESELMLRDQAAVWIKSNEKQLFLFDDLPEVAAVGEEFCEGAKAKLPNWSDYRVVSVRYGLLYDSLRKLFDVFGFDEDSLLNDLVIARIVSPGSKLHSLKFLEKSFGVRHSYRSLTRALPSFIDLKDDIESKVIDVARKHFGFNFSLVFYDLTTLYFESFETDELRRIGFSKDNKSSNPQVMIGLLVNDLGFPISYQLFAGNKFEGHTLLPSINSLRNKHKIQHMTVVADSAMISDENIKFLKQEKLDYIVAARTANLPIKTIEEIAAQLNQKDETTIRIPTASKGDLILSFSQKRYAKEKREMDKQLEKANHYLKHPSAAEIIKRTKFLKGKKLGYELNSEMIHKTNLLLGIKGYYSNCSKLTNEEIIGHYKNLWHVEKAFRISKSDLKMRPIYHFKESSIKAHILICFMALALAKYIELNTGKSIKSFIHLLEQAPQSTIINKNTKEQVTLNPEDNPQINQTLQKLNLPH